MDLTARIPQKGPDLIEETEEEIQLRKETKEAEGIEYNIQQISKAVDLSPRNTNSLKNEAKKGRPALPLQVKTRRSKEKVLISNQ